MWSFDIHHNQANKTYYINNKTKEIHVNLKKGLFPDVLTLELNILRCKLMIVIHVSIRPFVLKHAIDRVPTLLTNAFPCFFNNFSAEVITRYRLLCIINYAFKHTKP